MADMKPWEEGLFTQFMTHRTEIKTQFRKARASVYYPKWEAMIMAFPKHERIQNRVWDVLSKGWETENSMMQYGTATKAEASLRALKVAILDHAKPVIQATGCIINRCVDPPFLNP
jgi:hypothetical protein